MNPEVSIWHVSRKPDRHPAYEAEARSGSQPAGRVAGPPDLAAKIRIFRVVPVFTKGNAACW